MLVYLELIEVYGHENGGVLFLWLVSNIKISVTASYVMGRVRTDVFMSVICNARGSMELPGDEEWLRDSAVFLLAPPNTSFYPCWRLKSV